MTPGPPRSSRLPPCLRRPTVLDACSLLNLYAAGPPLDDLAELGVRFHVVPQVRKETLFVRGDGPGLHDGEAASAAVAASRDFSLLTDEAPARRVMAARKCGHLLLTTADVLKVWVAAAGVDAGTLREMIRRIEHRASFTIQRNHHLKPWWDQAAGRA